MCVCMLAEFIKFVESLMCESFDIKKVGGENKEEAVVNSGFVLFSV